MAKKQNKQNQKRLVVSLRHVAAPDGNARVLRTIEILLRTAARGSRKDKKGPTGDGLTDGDEAVPHG